MLESVPSARYWLGFNHVSGIGPTKLQRLLDHFSSVEAAWGAGETELAQLGLDQRAIRNLVETRQSIDLEFELARLSQVGARPLTWHDAEYPRYLREIPDAPPFFYLQGALTDVDQWAIAIVGTRRCSAYGRHVTRQLVEALVANGITIVSGLARGTDTLAHKVALEQGGRTIAVLGSGLDAIYPPENRALAGDIVASGLGAVMTEYRLGTRPEARNFPPRNRVISGLSLGTVVVEAGERSGALITARFAVEQDREVFAVPGNINSPSSAGTNALIQQGAKLVTGVDDILEELNLAMVAERVAAQLALPESHEEAALLVLLSAEPAHIDELVRRSGLSSAAVTSTLTLMELKGMVRLVGRMHYVIGREPGPVYATGSADVEPRIARGAVGAP
jgi:DNA processing protein